MEPFRGTGTIRFANNYTVGRNPTSIISFNFNNDGNIDLAVTNYRDNTVVVLLGSKNGIFQTPTTYAVG